MDYSFLKRKDEECFVEIIRGSFRTKIEFNWSPNEDFKGIAVCCNYHKNGNPIGFMKDNSLVVSKIPGNKKRPVMKIDGTMIQAGPSLVKDSVLFKDFQSEGFSTHDILRGFHAHIGIKKSGNIIIGFTTNHTLAEISREYIEFNAVNAIKLPGFDKGAFLCQSNKTIIEHGNFPAPAVLIFESLLKK